MEQSELPEGWEWRPLGDLLTLLQYGTSEKTSEATEGLPVIRMGNIQGGAVVPNRLKYLVASKQDIARYKLERGDILINRTNSTELVGKAGLFALDGDFLFASYLIRLKTDCNKVIPEFLNFFLGSETAQNFLKSGSKEAVGQSNSNTKHIKLVPIPLPSLPVQRYIVGRIEAQSRRVEAIRKAQADLVEEMRGVLAGYYAKITANADWKTLGEIAPQVRRPVLVQAGQSYPELGIRSFGKGTFPKPAITAEQLGSKRIFHIQPGDLIFNNVFAWEGAVAVVRPEDAGRVGSHRFITCVPEPGVATTPFLYFHFTTAQGLHDLGDASPGGAGRNRTLGLTKLAAIKVPMPDYDKQLVFARLWEKAQEIRRLQDELTADLAAYVPSILAKVFRGEL